MDSFLRDFGKLAGNSHVKHVMHRLNPVVDAGIMKAASKIQSMATGGRVKGVKKGAPKMIKAHVGEFVLPGGVAPTKVQKAAGAKRKVAAKKKCQC